MNKDYEIRAQIVGLDHNSFDEYVRAQGGNPEEYYNKEMPKGILLNLVKEDMEQPLTRTKYIPYLNEKIESLSFNEYGEGKGFTFNMDIGLKTTEIPIKDSYLGNYDINIFVPKEALNSLMENFELPGDNSHSERMRLLVDKENIIKVEEKNLVC